MKRFEVVVRLGLIFAFVFLIAGGAFLVSTVMTTRETTVPSSPASTIGFAPTTKSSQIASALPSPTLSTVPSPTTAVRSVLYEVPFSSQAPLGQWDDYRYQNGCEEASMMMAMAWVEGKKQISKDEATKTIADISAFEVERYGHSVDHDAKDTAQIMRDYYGYDLIEVKYDIGADDIVEFLMQGAIVITPMNGRLLNNPNFTAPGPLQHMVVVIGYDKNKNEFITNDPGTRKGKHYRYDVDLYERAVREYPTGEHEPILTEEIKSMIVVRKV